MFRRYWIVFEEDGVERGPYGRFLPRGVGVTGRSREDALALVRAKLCGGEPLPAVRSVLDDVDLSTLDARHVRPNVGRILPRGVWWPPVPLMREAG